MSDWLSVCRPDRGRQVEYDLIHKVHKIGRERREREGEREEKERERERERESGLLIKSEGKR